MKLTHKNRQGKAFQRLGCMLAGFLWLTASGCSTFDLKKNIPWGESILGGPESPMRIVCMWSDTVMHQGGQPARRGFGGRVMFYDQNARPIKVAGTLVVYAFDETNRDPTNPVPDRKFVFTADQFSEHYSKSRAGHSYSFWLPWDVAGGEQKEISLIARFTPQEGGVVISEQARVLLPGPVMAKPTRSSTPGVESGHPTLPNPAWQGEVQQTAYQASNYSNQPTKLETTTIQLPRQFGGRLPSATISQPHHSNPALQAPSASQPGGEGSPAAPGATLPAARGAAARHHSGPPQRARFSLERHRALGGPLAELNRAPQPMPPSPAESPSVQTFLPQSATGSQSEANAAATW